MTEEYMRKQYITPEWAKAALSTQVLNRRIKPNRVKQYANDMKKGQWTICNAPVCFDTDGNLVDGQHRLMAVIESDTPTDMYVIYNLPKEAVQNIDQGAARSASDSLRMSGDLNPDLCSSRIVAIARCYLKIALTGSDFDTRCLSTEDLKKFLIRYGKECSLAVSISKKGNSNALLDRAASGSAIFAAIINDESVDKLYRFAECVNSGIIDGVFEHAALVCRNYLQSIKLSGQRSVIAAASVTEQAIADFVIGKDRVRAYPEDKHPYIKTIKL